MGDQVKLASKPVDHLDSPNRQREAAGAHFKRCQKKGRKLVFRDEDGGNFGHFGQESFRCFTYLDRALCALEAQRKELFITLGEILGGRHFAVVWTA